MNIDLGRVLEIIKKLEQSEEFKEIQGIAYNKDLGKIDSIKRSKTLGSDTKYKLVAEMRRSNDITELILQVRKLIEGKEGSYVLEMKYAFQKADVFIRNFSLKVEDLLETSFLPIDDICERFKELLKALLGEVTLRMI